MQPSSFVNVNNVENNNLSSSTISINDNFKLKTRILPKDFEFDDKDLKLLLKTTDIESNKYEGGLKIWECSIDLSQCIINHSFINYLNKMINKNNNNNTLNVLELGCGHSLPSITFISCLHSLIIKKDDEEKEEKIIKINICLQDLNKDVLKHISIPNIWLNCTKWINSEYYKSLNAVCGDWRDIKLIENLLKITRENNEKNNDERDKKYDVIFGSETIYNQSMIEILMKLLIKLLSKPNGICFISAKSYYFGIGGGTQSLKLFMKNDENNKKYPFECNTIQRIDDGMSNLRETIILTWKDKCKWNLSSIWSNIDEFESEEDEEADDDDDEQDED